MNQFGGHGGRGETKVPVSKWDFQGKKFKQQKKLRREVELGRVK